MLLKSDIKKTYDAQQDWIKIPKPSIKRNFLDDYKPAAQHIEVITGIRRCGKSTLMKYIMDNFYSNYAYFNFEDARIFGFDVKDFTKLDEIIDTNPEAYFFDEIQNVPNWEIYIRQLHDRGKKVFITGSNASLLSRELGTRLTGRHLRHELFPFSYNEYLEYKNIKNSDSSFMRYFSEGGFPEYLNNNNPEILQSLLKDIVLRDIAVRNGIKNVKVLMDITLFLLSNLGKEHTYNSLRKSFALGSANTVSDYLSWLEDAYLFFFLPRFSWSTKSISVNPRKVYAVDNGMANANTLIFSGDNGRLLENLVYLFLRKKEHQLYYFKENKECDFVVIKNKKCEKLIQVCVEINSDNLLRETEGLNEAMHFFGKKEGTIITLNQRDRLSTPFGNIELIPINELLLK